MLSVNNLSLQFGKRILFDEVNITFSPGNCYGIIGANGAGKSTFLKILSKQKEGNSGSISLESKKRLSVLEQDHNRYDRNNVLETVILGNKELFEIKKQIDDLYANENFSDADAERVGELQIKFEEMDGWNAEADAAFLLSSLGIKEESHQHVMDSIDQKIKVKVLLAQCIFGNPDVLIMDEPTNDLDYKSVEWLVNFIQEFENTIIFKARDYHHLIDCPIMISEPDTATFMVANTKVFIETHFNGEESGYANLIKKEIQHPMKAVATFTDSLPVDEYHFIMYIRDGRDFMDTLHSKDISLFKKAKTVIKNVSMFSIGALEHGNSSFYTLTDFGDSSYTSMIKRVALHEFMHIFTPLNLHSEYIGEFDYVNPRMSKHLWLYEGITEYFANLIQVQSGLITPLDFFAGEMSGKIRRASKYPETKISFTEMSERVFEKKYGRHYRQVYQRGAIIGLLLDIEIIRLTNGEKTLKDIVLALSSKFGSYTSFNEETIFDEFTALVHPDLRKWFADHVEGTVPLDVKGGLAKIGIDYSEKGKHNAPKRILNDFGSKEFRISFGKYRKVRKVGKKDPVGFEVGDQIDTDKIREEFYDDKGFPVEEGKEVNIIIKRDDEIIKLPYSMELKERKYKHRLRIMKEPTEIQSNYYAIWLGQ